MKKVDSPTYTQDITGEISRFDERDVVLARKDLFRYFGESSPQYKAYYEMHPDQWELDRKIGHLREFGTTGGIDAPMSDAQFETVKVIGTENVVHGQCSTQKTIVAPHRGAEKVKALAHLFGVDLVKIGPLRQEWIYSHTGRSYGNQEGYFHWGTPIDLSSHTHAVALGFQMNLDLMRSAPDFPVKLATGNGYTRSAWAAVQLAKYIQLLGYSARAHHLTNYQVLCVPVAIDCGLGELSRAGYLITKEFGLGLRLAIVTTEMPLAHDPPIDIAAQSFCETCKICAEECPIGAIPMGDKFEHNGVKKWKLDEGKCYRYWHAVGTDCGLCMISCPWTKPRTHFHQTMSALASVKGYHQTLMTQAHKLFYGKFKAKPRPEFMEFSDG